MKSFRIGGKGRKTRANSESRHIDHQALLESLAGSHRATADPHGVPSDNLLGCKGRIGAEATSEVGPQDRPIIGAKTGHGVEIEIKGVDKIAQAAGVQTGATHHGEDLIVKTSTEIVLVAVNLDLVSQKHEVGLNQSPTTRLDTRFI